MYMYMYIYVYVYIYILYVYTLCVDIYSIKDYRSRHWHTPQKYYNYPENIYISIMCFKI